ncbi:MAG: signal recognition particle-docking protein FtsY [Lachnospiraceae bacterium]|nr:signal recognition particle-docking protein FtsY [Lachnospiraceae bacterium]
MGENEQKRGAFSRLAAGLSKTRSQMAERLSDVFSSDVLDDDFFEDIEEVLIESDMGPQTAVDIAEQMKLKVRVHSILKAKQARSVLQDLLMERMKGHDAEYSYLEQTSVIFFTGVNGAGKTTTIGKIAALAKEQGREVLIAGADTFRAAAGEQLAQWAERAGVRMIGGSEGQDPGSVLYDAVAAAKARGVNLLLVDTAGRLQNKTNLMNELNKLYRILQKQYSEAHLETWLVLDATTGQNGLSQAREFSEAAPIDALVITKMDGSARGGIAVALTQEMDIPVKYIGVGEGIHDLQRFDPEAYVRALMMEEE